MGRRLNDSFKSLVKNILNEEIKKETPEATNNPEFTDEEIFKIARNCTQRSDLYRKNWKAYRYAIKTGLIDKLFPPKYPELEIVKAATECISPKEFYKKYPYYYERASELGILKDLYPNRDFVDDKFRDEYLNY